MSRLNLESRRITIKGGKYYKRRKSKRKITKKSRKNVQLNVVIIKLY